MSLTAAGFIRSVRALSDSVTLLTGADATSSSWTVKLSRLVTWIYNAPVIYLLLPLPSRCNQYYSTDCQHAGKPAVSVDAGSMRPVLRQPSALKHEYSDAPRWPTYTV